MAALTRTERDLLGSLRFRAECGDGACWLVATARGREALVVPTLLDGWPLERLRVYQSRTTLRRLGEAGLIAWGDDEPCPTYRGRRPHDSRSTAQRVWITAKGRDAIAANPTAETPGRQSRGTL